MLFFVEPSYSNMPRSGLSQLIPSSETARHEWAILQSGSSTRPSTTRGLASMVS